MRNSFLMLDRHQLSSYLPFRQPQDKTWGQGGGTKASSALLMLYRRMLGCKGKLMTMMVGTNDDDDNADESDDDDGDDVEHAPENDENEAGKDRDVETCTCPQTTWWRWCRCWRWNAENVFFEMVTLCLNATHGPQGRSRGF